ncbi:hypothetical protein OIU85_018743 [Salix viminalis]|uniref:Uncharacterized protein n=1 Tax=Salix viminalis TaxID=40686 RepID=A0A9Q0UUE0_SALVM|nr:hypothetical protein OIU85_018743 [Salix viminalis]
MASLSSILSSYNPSLRSDAFGDKLFSIRPVAATTTTGRETGKMAMKARTGGGGRGRGEVRRDAGEEPAADRDDRAESDRSEGSMQGRRDIGQVQGSMGRGGRGEPSQGRFQVQAGEAGSSRVLLSRQS